jgi:hypothetical protein
VAVIGAGFGMPTQHAPTRSYAIEVSDRGSGQFGWRSGGSLHGVKGASSQLERVGPQGFEP